MWHELFAKCLLHSFYVYSRSTSVFVLLSYSFYNERILTKADAELIPNRCLRFGRNVSFFTDVESALEAVRKRGGADVAARLSDALAKAVDEDTSTSPG